MPNYQLVSIAPTALGIEVFSFSLFKDLKRTARSAGFKMTPEAHVCFDRAHLRIGEQDPLYLGHYPYYHAELLREVCCSDKFSCDFKMFYFFSQVSSSTERVGQGREAH